MGLGWQVALERELPGVDTAAVRSKALLFYQHELEVVAEQLALPSLTQFVCAVPDKVAEYLRQQGLDPEAFPIPDVVWYPAAEGLLTVRGLLGLLRNKPSQVTDPVRIIQDLAAIEQILSAAELAEVAFHLTSELPQDLGAE